MAAFSAIQGSMQDPSSICFVPFCILNSYSFSFLDFLNVTQSSFTIAVELPLTGYPLSLS